MPTENTEKFTGKAELYAKYRPSYPSALIDYLWEKSSAKNVADIGAGTGIFTRCLESKPWTITAVEPNHDMRSFLETTVSKKVTVIYAAAEKTKLADGAVDLVTVAQAFHWFDKDAFKAELNRILTPEGYLAIIWNGRTKSDFSDARNDFCQKICPNFSWGHAGRETDTVGDVFLRTEFYSQVEFTEYENPMFYTLESFIGDNLSRSYAPNRGDETYDRFIQGLTDVFDKFQKNGIAEMPYKTTCYFGRI